MLRNLLSKSKLNSKILYSIKFNNFTGKTQTGWKFTTPTLRMKCVRPIYPPPGMNLEVPSKFFSKLDWSPKLFCERIGGDCHEVADKFENINEFFECKTVSFF